MTRLLTAVVLLAALLGAAETEAAVEYRTVSWKHAYAPADRRVVRISLIVRPALRPQRVRVREEGGHIRISLLVEMDDRPSTADAVTDCVEVRLRSRVGVRKLLDRTRPRPRSGPRDGPIVLSGPRPCRRLRAAR